VQHKVAKSITGGLNTTAGDTLDVHAYILPLDLLMCNILFRVALRLCSLPPAHPLHAIVRSVSARKVKRHLSPIHNLIYFAKLNPKEIKSISPVRHTPGYSPSFKSIIAPSKEDALEFANITNIVVPIRVYSDGSGFKGGIGASALLYIKDRLSKVLRCHLGSDEEHTVYEAEGVGLAMGLHLLKGLNRQLNHPAVLGTDSQALIKALDNQRSHAGQYILDNIHLFAEQLHAKQDALINHEDRSAARAVNRSWKGRTKGVVDLQVHWVPGHCDFGPNEQADVEAKKAAEGDSSDTNLLPSFLWKSLPLSISALRQLNLLKLRKRWEHRWKSSSRESLLRSIDNSAPSKKYIRLTKPLDRRQSSILFQLRTGHIGLNHHLFRIHKAESPACPHCQGITVETVKHFLLDCPQYRKERHALQCKLRRNAGSLSFLLSNSAAIIPLLKFVQVDSKPSLARTRKIKFKPTLALMQKFVSQQQPSKPDSTPHSATVNHRYFCYSQHLFPRCLCYRLQHSGSHRLSSPISAMTAPHRVAIPLSHLFPVSSGLVATPLTLHLRLNLLSGCIGERVWNRLG
jgi:ribonuclease HI